MTDPTTSAAVRRARRVCALGALLCAAVFLVSMFAASMQEDRTRVRAAQHGLYVCHPEQTCKPPADSDVGCAGYGNELCHLADGEIVQAGTVEYADAKATGWKILCVGSGLIGLAFALSLAKLTSGERVLRKQEARERARIDKAIREAEARGAAAREAAARKASRV